MLEEIMESFISKLDQDTLNRIQKVSLIKDTWRGLREEAGWVCIGSGRSVKYFKEFPIDIACGDAARAGFVLQDDDSQAFFEDSEAKKMAMYIMNKGEK